MIFYEAPHKLPATLKDLAATFGPDRPISLCRELSKLHEEIRRTTLGEAADYYDQNPPRGEFVLVVRGAAHRGRGGHPGGRFGAGACPAGGGSLPAGRREAGLQGAGPVPQRALRHGGQRQIIKDKAAEVESLPPPFVCG